MRVECLLCGALFALSAGIAHADETRARDALAEALSQAGKAACASPRLAFTETVAEKGVVVSARFDPSGAPGHWRPVGAPPRPGQETKTYQDIVHDTPDERDLFLDRLHVSLGDEGRLVSETEGVAVFDFALSPKAHLTHSLLDGAADLPKHVRVAVGVDEQQARLTSFRFYAPSSFAATPVAQVQRLDLSFTLGPSYAGGSTLVRKIDTDAAYRILGVEGATHDTVWFSDVAPVFAAPRRTGQC